MEAVHGKITVAPAVLHTIVRLTVLAVPGVYRLSPISPVTKSRRIFQANRRDGDGISIRLAEGALNIDIHICALADGNMHELGLQVKNDVRRAMEEMVGMDVRA